MKSERKQFWPIPIISFIIFVLISTTVSVFAEEDLNISQEIIQVENVEDLNISQEIIQVENVEDLNISQEIIQVENEEKIENEEKVENLNQIELEEENLELELFAVEKVGFKFETIHNDNEGNALAVGTNELVHAEESFFNLDVFRKNLLTEIDQEATFTIKIPKTFAKLIESDNNIVIPQEKVEVNGSIEEVDIFKYENVLGESDEFFEVYRFSFSDRYKEIMNDPTIENDSFTTGHIIFKLTAQIEDLTEEELLEQNKIVMIDDSTPEETTVDVPFQKPDIPTDPVEKATISKKPVIVGRKDTDGAWKNVIGEIQDGAGTGKKLVRHGDIIIFSVTAKNTGSLDLANLIVTENPGLGLEFLDSITVTEVYDVFKDLPVVTEAQNTNNDVWILNGEDYNLDIAELLIRQEKKYLIYFKIKDFANAETPWTDIELKNELNLAYSDKNAVGTSSEITIDYTEKSDGVDLATSIYVSAIVRNGSASYVDIGRPTHKPTVVNGDTIIYTVELFNQSTGNIRVEVKDIVDYIPTGLEYDPSIKNGDKFTSVYRGSAPGVEQTYTVTSNNWELIGSETPQLHSSWQKGNRTNDLYKVDIYKNTDLTNNPVTIATGKSYKISIALKVKDLDDVLTSVGMLNKSTVTAEGLKAVRELANVSNTEPQNNERIFSPYYNSAEIILANQIDVDGNFIAVAIDSDSDLDQNPWDDTKFEEAEVTNIWGKEIANSLLGKAKQKPANDEDDYDYALLKYDVRRLIEVEGRPVNKKLESEPLKNRIKQIPSNIGDAYQRIINQLSIEDDAIIYGTNKYGVYNGAEKISATPILENGNKYNKITLSNNIYNINLIETVFGYTIEVNPDGVSQFNDVIIEDVLPQGIKLLKDKNGNPIVRVTEYTTNLQDNGAIIFDEEGYKEITINPRDEIDSQFFDVKAFLSDDFLDSDKITNLDPGKSIYYYKNTMPVTRDTLVVSGKTTDKVNFWADKITSEEQQAIDTETNEIYDTDKLTVSLGNVDRRSFDVTFLVYVEDMVGGTTLNNQAILKDGDIEYKTSSLESVHWNNLALSSFTSKSIIKEEKRVGVNKEQGEEFSVEYSVRIRSNSEGEQSDAFKAGKVEVQDNIQAPNGSTAELNLDSVKVEAFEIDYSSGVPKETPIQATETLAIKKADVTYENSILDIINSEDIPGNRVYYINFVVNYKNVKPGTKIPNKIFEKSVLTMSPIKFDILKIDKDLKTPIKDVTFKLFYGKQGATADEIIADKEKPASITNSSGEIVTEITTDINGKGEIYFAPEIEDYLSNKEWNLVLVETNAPTDYFGNINKELVFKITKDINGNLILAGENIIEGKPITIENEKLQVGFLKIIKVDKEGNKLSNATFEIEENIEKGLYSQIFVTDKNGEAILNLKEGDYKLREIKAPTGYILDSKVFKVHVDKENRFFVDEKESTSIEIINKKILEPEEPEIPYVKDYKPDYTSIGNIFDITENKEIKIPTTIIPTPEIEVPTIIEPWNPVDPSKEIPSVQPVPDIPEIKPILEIKEIAKPVLIEKVLEENIKENPQTGDNNNLIKIMLIAIILSSIILMFLFILKNIYKEEL